MFIWSLFRGGTNHPSIAHRGVSCSKVDLEESESKNRTIFNEFWKLILRFFLVVLEISLMRIFDC